MKEATAKSVSRIGQANQLIRGQKSTRDLDPLHLHSLLTLGIRAEVQTQLLHLCLIEFAGANTDSVAGLRFISVHLYIAGPIASTEYFLWPDKPPACCTLDQNDSVLQKN